MVTWYKFTFGVNVNFNLSILSLNPGNEVALPHPISTAKVLKKATSDRTNFMLTNIP